MTVSKRHAVETKCEPYGLNDQGKVLVNLQLILPGHSLPAFSLVVDVEETIDMLRRTRNDYTRLLRDEKRFAEDLVFDRELRENGLDGAHLRDVLMHYVDKERILVRSFNISVFAHRMVSVGRDGFHYKASSTSRKNTYAHVGTEERWNSVRLVRRDGALMLVDFGAEEE